ncbi:pentapeptide repeat-containing protein [Streptomyces sp. NRRL B-24484]|uniref:pentapeptide repeat-containing protein n=1 Tax=Streptomyces sp. NRRL B-24484 TaxID=1463833 RepID=UPI0004BF77F7|nr:pentapeptide repeat-containing protein [Streptomyces sp. NRRL B-24484]
MNTAPSWQPPEWPHCGHGAVSGLNPVGCRGIHVPGRTACLAHLADAARDAYLADLAPCADIDHRGTHFTKILLNALLQALRDPTTGRPHLGTARFDEATFSSNASFGGASFAGDAEFRWAKFSGDAWFRWAKFSRHASFVGAEFSGNVRFDSAEFLGGATFENAEFASGAGFVLARFSSVTFHGAKFAGDASFGRVKFSDFTSFDRAKFFGIALFSRAKFSRRASFVEAEFSGFPMFDKASFSSEAVFRWASFSGDASFVEAEFSGDATFDRARFAALSSFGPLVCVQQVDLSGATFEAPVTIEIAASTVRCVRTQWNSTVTLRLRYATLDLGDAVLSSPVAVTTHPAPFTTGFDRTMDESELIPLDPSVQVISVQGVDASHLVLTNTDLTSCVFSGAFHLDQLRLEGRCSFASTPAGFHMRGIWPYCWWTRRYTLTEEHHWRAHRSAENPSPPHGWHSYAPRPTAAGPESLAATYRQLRKAFEDRKNEPGAADFYYGEMEMRRHDQTGTPRAERALLCVYWLLSGYGLRASRALLWLGVTMTSTVLAMILWGLPTTVPLPSATGTITGNTLSLSTNNPDLSITGDQWSLERADRAVRVSVNAVVFRTSGQNLTRRGTYIEMVSRIIEPILLALALLAIRARVKR